MFKSGYSLGSTPICTAGPSIALNDSEPSYLDDPSMPHLEDIYASPSQGVFTDSSYDDEAFASYMGFIVYQMDVNSAFLYGTIDEEVYVIQPPGFVDPKFPNKVKQKEDGIFISQDMYVAKILKKFDFLSVKTASTPIETHKPLVKDEEAVDVDVHLYRSMIGSL
nr:copia protein [Tanacetum cinerariifolium]